VLHAELFRLFFEESSDALLAVKLPSGTILGANKSFSTLTGFSVEEIESENMSVLTVGSKHGDIRERTLDLEVLKASGFYNDIAIFTRDGAFRIVSVKVKHVQFGGENLALAVLSDDTERQLLLRDLMVKHQSLESAYQELERVHQQLQVSQDKMAQSSKLAALGELSAGLSHELNQPLTGIKGFSQEILDVLRTDQKPSKKAIRKLTEEVILNSNKMAGLLAHFRNFARAERDGSKNKNTDAIEVVDLKQSLDSVLRLLGRQIEKVKIACTVQNVKSESLLGKGLAASVEQILVNLVTNSRDALLERMAREPETKFLPRIAITLDADPRWVYVRVQDNGSGISESIQRRIFDPFFTTKDPGKGLGLGLSISFGIAHRLGGELSLESSTPGSGTCFLLKLPRHFAEGLRAA
jgi:PAS domain S-box-containing protein